MRYGDVPDPSLWVEVDITEIQRLRRKEERKQTLEAMGPDAVAKVWRYHNLLIAIYHIVVVM